jgi:hypothetical protein
MNKPIDKVQTTNPNESVVNGEVVTLALRQPAIPDSLSTTAKVNLILEALRNIGIISRF